MVTISLCMIVRNEEDVLARCLDSVCQAVDEIIIVDTGSTDQTKRIAATYTDRILDFDWIDDFAAARNHAFAQARMDYILWLDADDVLPKESMPALKRLKAELDPAVSVVMMPYHAAFDAQGRPLFVYPRERLIKNHAGFVWEGAVHEVITPRDRVLHSDIVIEHRKVKAGDPDRNLRIFEQQRAAGKRLGPRQHYYYARELHYHQRYAEAAAAFADFLSMPGGWLENRMEAYRLLAFCLERQGKTEEAVSALLRSLLEDAPRAEICCDIGRHLLNRGRLKAAVFWYEAAAACQPDLKSGGFVDLDCYHYIPYVQLCVCHYRLGQRERAEHYHRLAESIHPEAPAVIYNRRFFA